MAGAVKTGSAALPAAELYERDYYAWILDQVRALRERRTEDVDWVNVAEEIEDLGKSKRRELRSQISRLYEHLLKLAYARGRTLDENRRGWEITLRGARREIRELLEESPSLRAKIADLADSAFQNGRDQALSGLNLPDEAIPEESSWSFEQAMDDDFLPASADANS
jgi:hypothetical protein